MKQFRDSVYFITEDGRVFNSKSKKFLSSTVRNRRYHKIGLFLNYGIKTDFLIHRLVAECYIPNPDNLPQVNHIDGNKANNHYSNLEWCTSGENIKHSHLLGLTRPKRGEKCNFAKLTKEDIIEIKKLYENGDLYQREIAEKFNVQQSAISRIINNKRWKHLND